jgi:hypothetical protein
VVIWAMSHDVERAAGHRAIDCAISYLFLPYRLARDGAGLTNQPAPGGDAVVELKVLAVDAELGGGLPGGPGKCIVAKSERRVTG